MGLNQIKERIKTWKKAIVVREPMERLASCYNDKMISPVERHMYPEIIAKKRKKVRKMAAKLLHNGHKTESISLNDFLIVNVINGKDKKHWRPYYKTCSPCTIGLDHIVKLDPAMEDLKVSFWFAILFKIMIDFSSRKCNLEVMV